MALTLDVNSYATVATADVYFENRIDASAWDAASELQKAQALVTASLMLNDIRWVGVATSLTQQLAFPREGSYYDPMLEAVVDLVSTVVPQRILRATYEMAFHLLTNDGILDDSPSVDTLTLSKLKLEGIRKPEIYPRVVQGIIRPLQEISSVSNAWWRAN